jgi:hypothetical protein
MGSSPRGKNEMKNRQVRFFGRKGAEMPLTYHEIKYLAALKIIIGGRKQESKEKE